MVTNHVDKAHKTYTWLKNIIEILTGKLFLSWDQKLLMIPSWLIYQPSNVNLYIHVPKKRPHIICQWRIEDITENLYINKDRVVAKQLPFLQI